MTLNEIWKMSYEEYVLYLLKKYGGAKCDYFRSPDCKSKGDIARTKEGLECHHIDEDKYPTLSHRQVALQYPFEAQKADRLVYADLIEHLILHIKIDQKGTCEKLCSGTILLIGSLNTIFEEAPTTGWRQNMYIKIKDNFDLYIEVLHRVAKTEYRNYLITSNQLKNIILPKENIDLDILEEVANDSQVDIGLLHKLSVKMLDVYPRLWLCPKNVKERKHWFFLTSTILCNSIHGKKLGFPKRVAKAFAMHESKQDYIFNEVSDSQMTLDDLLL